MPSIRWRFFRCGKFVIICDRVDPVFSLSHHFRLSGCTKLFHPNTSFTSSLFLFNIIVFLFLLRVEQCYHEWLDIVELVQVVVKIAEVPPQLPMV